MVHYQEAFKDTACFRNHLGSIAANLMAAAQAGSLANLEVHGPAAALDELKDLVLPLGCKCCALDENGKGSWARSARTWPQQNASSGTSDLVDMINKLNARSMKPGSGALFLG